MKSKIILFDMDGVMCQYDEKLLRCAHERFGLPLYQSHEVTHFNSEALFQKEYQERVEAIADEEGFFLDLKPFPGVIKAFEEITSDPRLEVFICTTPKRFYKSSSSVSEKHTWIARYLGCEWTDRMILTRDKTLVRGDILVDDKPEIKGVQVPSWVHVYHNRPYNTHIMKPRIKEWSSWKDILLPILFP